MNMKWHLIDWKKANAELGEIQKQIARAHLDKEFHLVKKNCNGNVLDPFHVEH